MPAVANDPSHNTISRKRIHQTHRASLAEPSNKDPFADLLITSLDSYLLPVLDLFLDVFVNSVETLLDFGHTVSLFLATVVGQMFDIVPACHLHASV
jgi:hypothetical protein